jgi:hypothetical protein
MVVSLEPTRLFPAAERALRRQLDTAISRAVVDPRYAEQLLANPTLALGMSGCTPQQRLQLGAIRADSVREFARQAESLFWPSPYGLLPHAGVRVVADPQSTFDRDPERTPERRARPASS